MKTHTKTSKFIHWTFSLLYAYGIFKQVEELDQLNNPSILMVEIVFAGIFLGIVFIRYFYMKDVDTLLGAKVEIPKGHLFIAKTIHRLVYLTLILLPTTGLIIAALFAYSLPGINFAVAIHEFSAFLSYALIGIHIVASIYSRLKGEGVWDAMVPIWKEKEKIDSEILSNLERIENKVYKRTEEIFKIK